MHDNPKPHEKIGVIGLGYSGLPLAMLFVSKGMEVIGIDVDRRKLADLQQKKSYLSNIHDDEITRLMESGKFEATDQFERILGVNTVVLCVPTPLRDQTYPDLSYVQTATNAITPYILQNQLIVLESSTFPGTTEEVLLPILERGGKQLGKDFNLGYSPQQFESGSRHAPLDQTPKVVSGVTAACLERIQEVYGRVFQRLVPVSTPRVAEMAQLMESAQRFIAISFSNEMASICTKMGINIWEVVNTIANRENGYPQYFPVPGIGGPTLPIAPIYLQWKARHYQAESKFIQLAKATNDSMPSYLIKRIAALFPQNDVSRLKILLLGVTYKKDSNDIRESSALSLMEQLHELKAQVAYHDPFIPALFIGSTSYTSHELTIPLLRDQDCVVLLTDHTLLPYEMILQHAPRIFDTRNSLPSLPTVEKL